MTIETNVEVGGLATFGVEAKAAALVRWRTADDLRNLNEVPRPLKVVGGGSNLLFTGDFGGTLLLREGPAKMRRLSATRFDVDAHMVLDDFCAAVAEAGLRGAENLSGIPGTLGGALVQNAGAYGAETGSLLVDATLFDLQTGRTLTVDREWMEFAYRSSRLKTEGGRYVVLSARLELLPPSAAANVDYGNLRATLGDAEPTPEAVRRAVLATRDSKLPDPATVGSAGSFFRNPEVGAELLRPEMPRYDLGNGLYKVPAAWLIDQCGLKGTAVGGAAVWPLQPLVIVNADGRATAADVLELEQTIVSAVERRFSITLIPEVEHL
ncbi:MAG: UDP-N-acetylmuramate dehydrogenase [Bacteroidales bacterium]|nr:UDP-N-acetylmuramate dehydrogenase [Bacteroidales bacterium]